MLIREQVKAKKEQPEAMNDEQLSQAYADHEQALATWLSVQVSGITMGTR